METKVKDASRPTVGDMQSSAQATQDLALQEGKPNARILRRRTKAWIEGGGWTGLLKVSQDPGPEVRAPDFKPGAFLYSCQMSPHKVWLFSLPSHSQDPSQDQGSTEPMSPPQILLSKPLPPNMPHPALTSQGGLPH